MSIASSRAAASLTPHKHKLVHRWLSEADRLRAEIDKIPKDSDVPVLESARISLCERYYAVLKKITNYTTLNDAAYDEMYLPSGAPEGRCYHDENTWCYSREWRMFRAVENTLTSKQQGAWMKYIVSAGFGSAKPNVKIEALIRRIR